MAVRVVLQQASDADFVASDAELLRWVGQAAASVGVDAGEVVVRVVDEAEGRELNRRWRGRDRATNVLSFPAGHSPAPLGDERPLGDIVLCAPVVEHEAAAQGKPLAHHYAHLVVHGVLHLLGHDHLDDEQASRMESLETELLAGWSIPDPYRSGNPPIDGQP